MQGVVIGKRGFVAVRERAFMSRISARATMHGRQTEVGMSSMRMSDHGLVNEYSIYSTERLEHRRCVFCAPSRPRTALSLYETRC